MDEAYLTSATTMPKGVKVVITDEDGEIYVPSSVEKPDLGTLDETTNVALNASVQGQSAQYSGEEAYHLFDGIITGSSNKWCGRGATGWSWLYPAGVYGCGQDRPGCRAGGR